MVRVSQDPARRGSWHSLSFPPLGASRTADTNITCASSHLCVAYATWRDTKDIAVLDRPTDPYSRWIRTNVDPEEDSLSVISGSCSRSACLVEQLNGAACAPSSSCLFTTGYGAIISSTQADGGASTWTRTRIYGTRNSNENVLETMACAGPGAIVPSPRRRSAETPAPGR